MLADLMGLEVETDVSPEQNAYNEGFEVGKAKKLEEILEFQSREQVYFAQTQLIFYEQFGLSIQQNISCFKKIDKIEKQVTAMLATIAETKDKLSSIKTLNDIPSLQKLQNQYNLLCSLVKAKQTHPVSEQADISVNNADLF